MASSTFSDGELNYFRVCKVTTLIIPDGLRQVFKKEWDAQCTATHGLWQDTAKNGIDFYSMESTRNKKMKSRELSIMRNGNSKEWDCTCLFHGILYSDSIKPTLNATVKKSVDELRKFRNEAFAHTADGKLTEADFKASINKVITSFTALKLDTTEIEEIKNQTSFPTDELEDIKKQLEKEKKRNEEPRPFCVLPPKPSHETVSRLNEVENIKKEMERLRNTKNNEVTVVYLSGNPGCGKSEVARQVGKEFLDEKSTEMDQFVMTLNASNTDTLLQSYVEFADRVKCDEDFITKIKISEGRTTEEKLSDLKGLVVPRLLRYSSWLIIVDNVTDLKLVSKYWPQAGEKTTGVGQILVTTQDSSSISHDSHTYHLSLKEGMNPDDAVKALSDISGISCQRDITLEIAKALDFQPLALACAAVYMRRIKGTDWAKYLQKLEEGKREATEKEYQKTSLTYQKTMTVAVRVAVEKEANEDEIMRHAFEFLSAIAPEPISLHYVVQYVMNCLPDEDKDLVASTIRSSSLVLYSEVDELEEVRVHQVVYSCLQEVALNKENEVNVEIIWNVILAFSGINKLNLDYIPDVVATRDLVEHFASLSVVIQAKMELLRDDLLNSFSQKHIGVSNCLRQIRGICYAHGRYEAADILIKLLYAIVENLSGDNDPDLAVLLNDIGNNLLYLGKHREAIEYLRRALSIEENTHGEHHRTIIATLNNIAKALCEMKRYEEATKHMERSLSILQRIYGEDHYLFARTLHIQGYIFQQTGNLKQAKMNFERVIVMEESQRGMKRHTGPSATLSNMGCLLRELGQLEESRQYLERAIESTESTYGEKHPALATFLRNLGESYSEQGQFESALNCFQRALNIEKRKHGVDRHPDQANSLTQLGDCLRILGRYEESKTCFRRALAIREKVYCDDVSNPLLLGTMNNLACSLMALGEYEEAYVMLGRVLRGQDCLFEDETPDFAVRLYNNLATTLYLMGKHQESKRYMQRALAVQERSSDLPPETLALTFDNLGRQECKFGQYVKAENYYRKAVAIQEKICPAHPDLGIILSNMGEALSRLGKYQEADSSLKRALSIQENVYGKEHLQEVCTLHRLGSNSNRMHNYEEARAFFERAFTIKESYYGKQHPEVVDTLCKIGVDLFEMKEYEEATTYLKRALSVKESNYEKEQSQTAPTLHNLGATRIANSNPSEDHPQMTDTIYLLGISYLELKRYKDAKIYLEKALFMAKESPAEDLQRMAQIQDKLGIAIREEKKQEQKQKREQRREQTQQRRERHKQKYVRKRK